MNFQIYTWSVFDILRHLRILIRAPDITKYDTLYSIWERYILIYTIGIEVLLLSTDTGIFKIPSSILFVMFHFVSNIYNILLFYMQHSIFYCFYYPLKTLNLVNTNQLQSHFNWTHIWLNSRSLNNLLGKGFWNDTRQTLMDDCL